MFDESYIARNCKCAQLRSATRLITRHYDEALKTTGINSGQFTLLVALELMNAPSITEAANALDMDRTTMTRNLNPLAKEGLVEITAGKGRAKHAKLTNAGKQTLTEAKPLWTKAQEAVEEQLGKTKLAELDASLRKLKSAFS